MHKPLVIALECLPVSCMSKSCLPSSFVDEVDIITPQLVLCGFVVCLHTEGGRDHDDFLGDNSLDPIHQEEMCFPCGLA
jgi:hypothetical protein